MEHIPLFHLRGPVPDLRLIMLRDLLHLTLLGVEQVVEKEGDGPDPLLVITLLQWPIHLRLRPPTIMALAHNSVIATCLNRRPPGVLIIIRILPYNSNKPPPGMIAAGCKHFLIVSNLLLMITSHYILIF